ncbi:PilZ domain-containing protein [Blastomonas marina]|uniref:PilZ domain-containing protein n=1 Tax=Blastomonas marina TaxID=1867408 RepID=UPI002AC8ABE8|nr:PilZ domain-containing protein [Blastomonas marina]WPZ04199.1 PilZ domain-containing protein [Blastomonas marina]
MGNESIRFFLRDGRIWVRGGEYADSVDLGPSAEVGVAMERFVEERRLRAARTEAEPPDEFPPPPQPSPPPLHPPAPASLPPNSPDRSVLPPSPVAPESHSTASRPRYQVDRSELRHELTIQARIVANSGPRDVTVLDLSESGCRFADRYRGLNPGDKITIKIGPIGPVRATVRWCDHGYVGIAFDNPLYPSVLEHIRDHFDIRK